MYDKLNSALASIKDPAMHQSVAVDVLSNRDTASRYINQTVGDKRLHFFYNVKPNEVAKAINLGLKANAQNRFFSLDQENPNATQTFGKPQQLWVSPPRGKLAGTQLESLGKNTMTKPTSIIEAVRSVEDKKLKEAAKPDFLDLDKDGDTDEPMKSAAKDAKKHEPADIDKDAVAKRKRLQALKDKQEDERAEKGDDYKSASRFVKGRAYGGSAQKDDEDKDELDEVAPPGAKAERMVKHIKKSYSKDSKLTPKEKSIAYATAWKAHNKGQVEEGRPSAADKVTKDLTSLADKKGYKSKKDFTSADWDEVAKPHGFTGKEVAAVRGHKFKEGTNFGDTIKNSKGKMTKVTVKEGKDAIRNHPIYTTKEAWDHYAEELAEQEAMDEAVMAPAVNVQQELDEIAKLAGLPTRACEACNCAPCKCDEGLEAMAPSDSSSPLTHAELDEAATRKDFRMVANLIKSNPDREKAKELAHHHADIFKQQNPRFKREMFLSACGLEECGAMPTAVIVGEDEMEEGIVDTVRGKNYKRLADRSFNKAMNAHDDTVKYDFADPARYPHEKEFNKQMDNMRQRTNKAKSLGVDEAIGDEMEEGNEFSGALAAAKASGAKDFEVDGKKYTVKEDININVSASGEEDAVNLIRKLSGMPVIAIQAAQAEEACSACGSSPCGCEQVEEQIEDGPKERDIEYTNSPREETAGADASFPGGTDLNRPKKSYSDKPFRGDNPMAESKEDNLWQTYETMINDIKA